ncbi:MAG TPA: phospholipase C, phosphocholine-specific [Chryseolinea sp.]
MDTRREFLKKATLLSAGIGFAGTLPASIQRAMAINPPVGSTYLDAEHVVILMQENRSFDHCYGTLQGVRGFNDPRAIRLPNKNLVWLQSNSNGETFVPFRLNIKDTKSTWMGSLPHSWTDQVDARNEGKYDKWLEAKKSGRKAYQKMPLTLGYYNREDIPFYYALADAFTICDQNFCSSLTGTTPNRLYLWTGTIREQPNKDSYANVRNENVDYGEERAAHWKTFPERLEEHNISWKIYQNELSVGTGFEGEEDAWLANFTDNPIEWFAQYNVKFLEAYIDSLPEMITILTEEITRLEQNLASPTSGDTTEQFQKKLSSAKMELEIARQDQQKYTRENFDKLSPFEKSIHAKAFTTNKKDPDYHKLTTLKYKDGATEREVKVPAGDVLFQFREDVKEGKLPTVSWLVAPENFSDHPGAPWYGAWYLSEVLDILTKNPEVWKKTIFILAYDENDGYFDHVPPFTVPNPNRPGTGILSKGIDASVEFVSLEQDMKKKPRESSRESSIGLGYRVPLVIASPWNRGGAVCSQVFDHTSVLQFLEKFLSHKTGKQIEEPNISAWRRVVCGDLTSSFRPYLGEKIELPTFLSRNDYIEEVHKAKFKEDPSGFRPLTSNEIQQINDKPASSPFMPRQEKGIRKSCAIPYQLYANGSVTPDKKKFQLKLAASREIFGAKAAGSPFNVYAPGKFRRENSPDFETLCNWSYAVAPGDELIDHWNLEQFEGSRYHICVYGPNGFYREYTGDENDPSFDLNSNYKKAKKKKTTPGLELKFKNLNSKPVEVELIDLSYGKAPQKQVIGGNDEKTIAIDLTSSHGWYDFLLKTIGNNNFGRRFAGRVETGEMAFTDPSIG